MPLEPEVPTAVNATVVQGIAQSQSRRPTSAQDEPTHTEKTLEARNPSQDEQPKTSPETSSDEEQGESQEISTNDAQLRCWGRYGKTFIWIGMVIMWTAFEMDHTVLYNYQNYAASDFGQISSIGALQTAGTIIIAVMKPPIAKISDVAGRVETYMAVVFLYIISYILCATSPNFGQYAGGYVIYSVGATGMQILNQIIVADITSSRWRGLANGLINLPFMIVPWLSAFIVESALANIGWRWGIGMFAIIMPVVSLGIIVPLLYFRHRSKKAGILIRRPTKTREFCVAIDLIGAALLTLGCGMFLLPMAIAGDIAGGWSNAWLPAVMVVGVLILAAFGVYETKYASNPIMPAKYFKSASLVLACVIGLLDAFAFQVTHTYMYAWSTVAHGFSARDATFLTYTSGCFQVLAGLVTGYWMYRTRRYKWLVVIGAIVRLVGYGVMLRLRGASNPTWELFVVQAIQGLGSGTVGTVVLVVAQIVVSKAELAQATALILLSIFMGQAIGSAVAGAIYTNMFRSRLRSYLGPDVPQSTIDTVFQSITGQLPSMGTSERDAINEGYSDILRLMTIAALVASAVPMLMVWFLPNLKLNDNHNLSEEDNETVSSPETQTEAEKDGEISDSTLVNDDSVTQTRTPTSTSKDDISSNNEKEANEAQPRRKSSSGASTTRRESECELGRIPSIDHEPIPGLGPRRASTFDKIRSILPSSHRNSISTTTHHEDEDDVLHKEKEQEGSTVTNETRRQSLSSADTAV